MTRIKKCLSKKTILFTIFELKTAINQAHNESPVSYMTVFRYLKGDLNFIFKKVDQNSKRKNCQKNKLYRFWWVHVLIQYWMEGAEVISIDETSFSTFNTSFRRWFQPVLFNNSKIVKGIVR